jgi:MoaA/NifB/PqqE/SkfB family radical SAM enzyme
MVPDLFHKVVDETREFIKTYHLGMSGEPFLHPYLFQFIDYIGSNNEVRVTTNGTLIEKRLDELLAAKNLNVLLVSMWNEEPRAGIEKFMAESKTNTQLIVKTFKEHPIHIPSCSDYYEISIRKKGDGWHRVKIGGVCYHLYSSPAVSWDGKLLSCCADHDHVSANGNLKEESFLSLWAKGFKNAPCDVCI